MFPSRFFSIGHCLLLTLAIPLASAQAAVASENNSDQLEQSYRASLELNPGSTELLSHLAALLESRKKYKAAIHYWQQALALRPGDSTFRLSLGIEYLQAGQYAEAISTLQRLIKEHLENEPALFSLGSAYARQGQYSQAVDIYGQALRLDPHDDDTRLAMASALSSLLRFEEARDLLTVYLARHSDDAGALSLLGRADQVLGYPVEAEANLRRAAHISPGLYDAQYNLGLVLLQTGGWQEAIDCFNRAATIRADSLEPHYQLAKAYRSLHNVELASRESGLVEQQRGKDVDRTRALVLANQASADLSAGKTQAAIDGYQSALALDSKNAKLIYDLALAYRKAGANVEERQALAKAETLDPALAVVHNQLGLLAFAQQDMESAKTEFNAAINDDPDFAEALSNLGVLYGSAGDVANAELYLRRAIESDPSLIQAHVNLGLMLAAEGKRNAALRAENDALSLAPEDRMAQVAKQRIEFEKQAAPSK